MKAPFLSGVFNHLIKIFKKNFKIPLTKSTLYDILYESSQHGPLVKRLRR